MLYQHGLAGLAQSHHDLDTWKFDSCDTSGHSELAASSMPKAQYSVSTPYCLYSLNSTASYVTWFEVYFIWLFVVEGILVNYCFTTWFTSGFIFFQTLNLTLHLAYFLSGRVVIGAPDRCYFCDALKLEASFDTRWRTDTEKAAMAGGEWSWENTSHTQR